MPIDDSFVRGVQFNVSLSDLSFHLLEAIMEGVALNIKWDQIYFEKLLGRRIVRLFAVEDGALWDSLCQMIADLTGAEV